jgi:thiosulfate/3-mercaptopyruvate sulfurtransferase
LESCLISADELAAAIQRAPGDVVTVDCRFELLQPHAGFHRYLKAHIPGARYAHLDKDLSRPREAGEGRHPLPDPDRFAATLGAWGIESGTRVVVYDDVGGAIAGRLWWMLGWLGHQHRQLLDGGFAAWVDGHRDTEEGMPEWTSRHYEFSAAARGSVVGTAEVEALGERRSRMLDARTGERFRGEREPIDAVAGHIPGTRNLPFPELMGADQRFKSPAELRQIFAERGIVDDGSDVVASCGSGVTACAILAALEIAGLGPGRLYAGSWSEWITDPSRPIATQS